METWRNGSAKGCYPFLPARVVRVRVSASPPRIRRAMTLSIMIKTIQEIYCLLLYTLKSVTIFSILLIFGIGVLVIFYFAFRDPIIKVMQWLKKAKEIAIPFRTINSGSLGDQYDMHFQPRFS